MRMRMLFDFGDSGYCRVSKTHNNGDFDFNFFLKVTYLEDYGDFAEKYLIDYGAVSVEACRDSGALDSAISCCGMAEMIAEYPEHAADYEMDALIEAGTYSLFGSVMGNNLQKLLRQVHADLDMSSMLFGFYMDRPQNRAGTNGWERIRGELVFRSYASA